MQFWEWSVNFCQLEYTSSYIYVVSITALDSRNIVLLKI
jgi:hypothetical protein